MADERILAKCADGRVGNLILSPREGFWSDCPCVETDPTVSAYQFFDDFVYSNVGIVTSKWFKSADTGTAALTSAATLALGGVMLLDTTAVKDKWVCLRSVDADVASGAFKITKDSGKKLWYAARVYLSPVTIADSAIYIGLGDGTTEQPAATATGAEQFTDGLYFRTLAATPDSLDIGYCNAGGGAESKQSAVKTLVGTTWYTLGLKFDGVNSIQAFVDGTAVGVPILADATDFPSLVGLTPYLHILNGSTAATSRKLYIDWVKCVQIR
jgi:hypothetical protein